MRQHRVVSTVLRHTLAVASQHAVYVQLQLLKGFFTSGSSLLCRSVMPQLNRLSGIGDVGLPTLPFSGHTSVSACVVARQLAGEYIFQTGPVNECLLPGSLKPHTAATGRMPRAQFIAAHNRIVSTIATAEPAHAVIRYSFNVFIGDFTFHNHSNLIILGVTFGVKASSCLPNYVRKAVIDRGSVLPTEKNHSVSFPPFDVPVAHSNSSSGEIL